MKRTRDVVLATETIKVPFPPAKGGVIFRMSPEDLLDGVVRGGVAWDPAQCVPAASSRMAELFDVDSSRREFDLSEKDEAAWQYIMRGPRGVKTSTALEPLFKKYSRDQLGLSIFNTGVVRTWMVDDDDYSVSSSSSSSESEEASAEASAESSEEVSYGPMDAWLDKAASKL
jgi:hypothetical protein